MPRPQSPHPSNLSAVSLTGPSQLEARGKDAIDIIHVVSIPDTEQEESGMEGNVQVKDFQQKNNSWAVWTPLFFSLK